MLKISLLTFKIFAFILLPLQLSLQPCDQVIIIGTNDIHGVAFPKQLYRSDTNEIYKYGGLVYMARLIEILQEENFGKTLYLDAGDQFQGGIQSSSLISCGQIMNDFYNHVGLKASALGNHQFDFGPSFLQHYLQNQLSDNLAANLKSSNGQSDFLNHQKSSKIYQINGFKIGVIGLATVQTLSTSNGFIKHLFPDYKFLQYKDIVIQQSSKLKADGADIIILLAHAGNRCQNNFTYGFWTTKNSTQICFKDQITDLLDNIPQGTVDAVLQGHRHTISRFFYKDIPIMGVTKGGYYFNAMHISYQKKSKKIKDIVIEGPIPVCQKVFQNTKTCTFLSQAQLKTAGKLMNWQFHGKDVYAQPTLETTFERKWKTLMFSYFKEICKNQAFLNIDENSQTELGNMITSLLHQIAPDADFALLNSGLFRGSWIPGTLQYQNFYSMFPFDDMIETFEITGKELIETLNVIQRGKDGLYPVWNLYNQLLFIAKNKTRIFVNAKFYNGTEIDNATTYRGVTTDFLLDGGDDFHDVIGTIYKVRNQRAIGSFRQLIQVELSKLKIIKQGVWKDIKHPRLNITII